MVTRQVFVGRTFHDGAGKGFKQPLACWATRLKDLKQSVGLFVLGCPFSKASFMLSLQHPSIEPRSHGGASRRYSHGNHTRH